MIISTGKVDKSLPVHLHKIEKMGPADPARGAARRDAVSISKFSALVEMAMSQMANLPEVRADRVSAARRSIGFGETPAAGDIAAAMINRAVEGQV